MTKNKKRIIKVAYFDEVSATDYITIYNGGNIDWTSEENKEKLAQILAQIDVQAKGGFNIFGFLKAFGSGNIEGTVDASTRNLVTNTITNSLLTDYISIAQKDKNIIQFHNDSVYAPEDSISMYKMLSSYLNIVPKDQMPIDLKELNNALLGERGYYQMLLNSERKSTCVLRFNINAFKNSYTLADLSKMKLSYYGVLVGECTKEQLSLEQEFEFTREKTNPNANEIVTGEHQEIRNELLKVYDIVLAGVMSHG